MTIGERIKELRTSLGLTQVEFCKRIGLKRNSISLVETGMRNISDQSIHSICREFHVSEEWLRSGAGEMFEPNLTQAIDHLADEYHLSDGARILVEKFVEMPDEHQEMFVEYFKCVSDTLKKQKESGKTPDSQKEGLS